MVVVIAPMSSNVSAIFDTSASCGFKRKQIFAKMEMEMALAGASNQALLNRFRWDSDFAKHYVVHAVYDGDLEDMIEHYSSLSDDQIAEKEALYAAFVLGNGEVHERFRRIIEETTKNIVFLMKKRHLSNWKMQSLTKECAKVKKELSQTEGKRKEMELQWKKERENMRRKAEETVKELEACKDRNSALWQRYEVAEKSLNRHSSEFKGLKDECVAKTKAIHEQQSRIVGLNDKCYKLEELLERLCKEKDQALKQLQQTQEDKAKYQSEVKQFWLEQRKNAARDKHFQIKEEKCVKEVRQLEGELNIRIKERKELEDKIHLLQDEIGRLQDEMRVREMEFRDEKARNDEQMNVLRRQVEIAEVGINESREKAHGMLNVHQQLREKNDRMEVENQKLRESLERQELEIRALVVKVESSSKDSSPIRAELAEREREVRALVVKIEKVNEEKRLLMTRFEQQEMEMRALVVKIENLSEEKATVAVQMTTQEREIRALVVKVESTNEDLDAARRQHVEMEDEIRRLVDKVEGLQREMAEERRRSFGEMEDRMYMEDELLPNLAWSLAQRGNRSYGGMNGPPARMQRRRQNRMNFANHPYM